MKYLYRLFFIMLFLGMFPLSCEKCDSSACECDDFSHIKDFEIQDLELRPINLQTLQEMGDTSSYFHTDTAGLVVQVSQKLDVPRQKAKMAGLFSSQLWACSPMPPHPVNRMAEVKITAAAGFSININDSIVKGEDITGRFLFSSTANLYSPDSLANFGAFRENLYIKAAFLLYRPSEIPFDLEVQLEDGKRFTFTRQKLRLK